MKRSELLSSNEFWISQIQNDLYAVINDYMEKNNLNRTQLAEIFGVTKGYITQVLNGDFDHKVSKLVDLSLKTDKVPLLYFVNRDEFIKADSEGKAYDLVKCINAEEIKYSFDAHVHFQNADANLEDENIDDLVPFSNSVNSVLNKVNTSN